MFRLISPLFAGIALAGVSTACASLSQQEPQQTAKSVAPPVSEAPSQAPASPALTTEACGALELIRSALEEGDRERARELLRETVSDLGAPPPGDEASCDAYLTELD